MTLLGCKYPLSDSAELQQLGFDLTLSKIASPGFRAECSAGAIKGNGWRKMTTEGHSPTVCAGEQSELEQIVIAAHARPNNAAPHQRIERLLQSKAHLS